MKFIDTHAHLFHPDFDTQQAEFPSILGAVGVEKVVLPNIDVASIPSVLSLASRFPSLMYATLGLHPCHVFENYKSDLIPIERLIAETNIVAIGECGLDYFHDVSFVEQQKKALDIQIVWAKELGVPIIIHCRNAFEDALAMMKQAQDGSLKAVFHCFTGTADEAKRVTDSGFFLGIGGVITYAKAGLFEQVATFDKNFVVLETDSPYLPPVPHRGKQNTSVYLPIINQKLADAWQISAEACSEITNTNAEKLFDFSRRLVNS